MITEKELEDELMSFCSVNETSFRLEYAKPIARFIVNKIKEDRKRVLDEVEKPLKNYKDFCCGDGGITKEQWNEWAERDGQPFAIDSALQTIHRLKGNL